MNKPEVDLLAQRATDTCFKSIIETLREFADNPLTLDLGGPAALRHVADQLEKALATVNG